jgi:hypothetical protein
MRTRSSSSTRHALGAALLTIAGAAAGETPMTITVVAKDKIARVLDFGTTILLSGEIQKDTPRKLRAVLDGIPRDDSWTYVQFDSLGGNLYAAMEIGRMLRAKGAITQIGAGEGVKGQPKPAVCLSACSLAFLGGRYRYSAPGSVYGVHRASSSAAPSSSNLDVGQIVAAATATYLLDMGVDTRLLELSVKAGKDGMYLLSEGELKNLGVVNNGRMDATWSIEVVEGGTYLRGVQETVWGEGKILFSCVAPVFQMMSVYTAGSAKAVAVAAGGWTHSMFVDNETVALGRPQRLQASGEYINASFTLQASALRKVAAAAKVGHAMQLSPDAPTYLGYQVDIDAKSRAKVSTYVGNCLR